MARRRGHNKSTDSQKILHCPFRHISDSVGNQVGDDGISSIGVATIVEHTDVTKSGR